MSIKGLAHHLTQLCSHVQYASRNLAKVAAAEEVTNWRNGPEECQSQHPTILSMLQRKLRSVELLLGLCQPECPSMTDLGSNVKYFQAKAQEDLDKMKLGPRTAKLLPSRSTWRWGSS